MVRVGGPWAQRKHPAVRAVLKLTELIVVERRGSVVHGSVAGMEESRDFN